MKNRPFKHVIVTLFNLKKFPLSVQNEKDWVEWTRGRIALFKTYCLPSFVNQTNRNFSWMIYFDQDTPEEFHPLFEELKAIPFVSLFFAGGHDDFMSRYRKDIRDIAGNAPWVIETRCDNDDCLNQDAVAAIQVLFNAQDRFMISLASGYTLHLQSRKLAHYFYPMSPFMSIVERNSEEMLGIFQREHSHWDGLKLGIIPELTGKNHLAAFALKKPYWIQVIHGNNVLNSFYRGLPVLHSRSLHEFGIDYQTRSQSVLDIPKYFNYVFWKRYFRCTIVRPFKKV